MMEMTTDGKIYESRIDYIGRCYRCGKFVDGTGDYHYCISRIELMSPMKCPKCGSDTNTAVCDWINREGCYAKFENGKWEKGCIFDTGNDLFLKNYATKLVGG